jgi:hypothetical protein
MRDFLKKYFFHTIGKKTIPPMQQGVLFGVSILLLISVLVGNLSDITISRIDQLLSAVLPSVIVELTNNERKDEHLRTLVRNPLLDEAARLKANHMKDNDYFEHFSPEGVSPWYWFDAVGYDYVHAGENLAVFFDDSRDVVKAWMNSPLHKDNILKADYTEIGVATVEAEHKGYKTVFVVQLFGTPVQKQTITQNIQQPVAVPQETSKVLSSQDEKKVFGVESVVAETPAETAEFIPQISETLVEELPEVVSAEEELQQVDVEKTNLVEPLRIENQTVYISDHANTSTVPVAGSMHGSSGNVVVGTKTILNLVYVLIFTLISVLSVISVVMARKQQQSTHVVYGVGIFVILVGTLVLHIQVVKATTLLL